MGKNKHIEKYSYYNYGFKTHKLSAKLAFAISMAHCDYSGVSLLGIKICDTVERKMFNEWSEVVRYQNPKTYSNLDFTVEDLKKYIEDRDSIISLLLVNGIIHIVFVRIGNDVYRNFHFAL